LKTNKTLIFVDSALPSIGSLNANKLEITFQEKEQSFMRECRRPSTNDKEKRTKTLISHIVHVYIAKDLPNHVACFCVTCSPIHTSFVFSGAKCMCQLGP
jgi:hypothetical protein